MMKLNKNSGFTLIELLVAVGIIVVLSTIGIVYYQSAQRKARDNKRKSDLEQVRAALEMYRSQEGEYPSGNWGTMIDTLQDNDYINQEPEDPRPGSYNYYYTSSGQTYSMCAYLEGDDPGSCSGSPSCGDDACNYGVVNP